jgi:hypothetical protein
MSQKVSQNITIFQNGEALGYICVYDDGIISTSGIIGENEYANLVDLFKGLQGFNIKIDDIFF